MQTTVRHGKPHKELNLTLPQDSLFQIRNLLCKKLEYQVPLIQNQILYINTEE
jgi:hypothetical protein